MGISRTRCVSQTGYLANENSKSETRGRSRHENNSKRAIRNMENGHNKGEQFKTSPN